MDSMGRLPACDLSNKQTNIEHRHILVALSLVRGHIPHFSQQIGIISQLANVNQSQKNLSEPKLGEFDRLGVLVLI